ncbi:nucleotide exchange factor GrpE [Halobacterium zhouii]|uniref:nucleotide exchange factor GrpE n=1 Tax=Halobacterium zhouii TaxID=2902624 RepID=UPI001E4ADFC3|nr:nucleotide exchange factor GrpE [Halobacterium zhouii]
MSEDAEPTAESNVADGEETEAAAESDQTAEESTATEATDDDPSLSARVREVDDELADEVADLEARVEELEGELDEREAELAEARADVEDLTERLQTKQADFQNYKQRAKQRQEDIRERATEDLVERLLDVRDNLGRALEDDSDDVESLREGVKLTRKEFDRVLDAEGVDEISPEPGEDVDAQRHEVMMRVESDQPAGTVASVYRPGYEMGGKVLQAAQVTVSEDGE